MLRLPSIAVSFALTLGAPLGAQHPVVPGVERLGSESGRATDRGVVLLHELSCTACHDAPKAFALPARPAPKLDGVGQRVTSGWLRSHVANPRAVKPGTTMPRVGYTDPATGRPFSREDREANFDALVHALAADGGPIPPARIAGNRALIDRGRELYSRIGCAACHEPADARATSVSSVPLGPLAGKTTVDALVEFLQDPTRTHPAARMPDLGLTPKEARALAMYLLRAQFENPLAKQAAPPQRPGLFAEYFEVAVHALPDFDELEPIESGIVPEIDANPKFRRRNEEYALRFRGSLQIPRDGDYVFFTTSDDGSKLRIDGEVVVDNDGEHGNREKRGKVRLTEGPHLIEVQFFEFHGGESLSVRWRGPGFKKQPIPTEALTSRGGFPMVPLGYEEFAIDERKLARGQHAYRALGCAACHAPELDKMSAKPLDRLDADAAGGCLSSQPAYADYGLSEAQKSDLIAAIRGKSWAVATDAATDARRSLAALNCYACHERRGIGGATDDRYDCFETKLAIDLGDEGKLPPTLSDVGDKLKANTLRALLELGKHKVRSRFMHTRMPEYPPGQAVLVTKQLVRADRVAEPPAEPELDEVAIEAGHRLVGTNGFACVTCHNVNGNRSPAIAGVDIAHSHSRLNYDWFVRFLKKPGTIKPDTRMPGFWATEQSPFTDVCGGSSAKQIDAVWAYLSLGASIPAPKGVLPPEGRPRLELMPVEEPIVHRTFMKGVSPRTILAGYPESVHVAFDAQGVRLAKVWRGRFFDASGVASGRTDKFLGPLGSDVLDVPGPAFAVLEDAAQSWPTIAKGQRDVGGTFSGYRLGPDRRPVFRYRLGDVEIEERPVPLLSAGGTVLRREFTLRSTRPTKLTFRAWSSDSLERVDAGTWRASDATVRLVGVDGALSRQSDGRHEVIVPLSVDKSGVRFSQEIRW